MKRFKGWAVFIISILIIWYIVSFIANNSFILPYPHIVFYKMILFLKDPLFYQSCFYTIFRAIISVILSFIIGTSLAFISSNNKQLQQWLEHLILILRSLPNVAIIILLLFWINRELTVFIVSFLLLFPIVYQSVLANIFEINSNYKTIFTLYPQSFLLRFRQVYLPLLSPSISSSLITTSSLAFKVGVMAEILGQVQIGLGRQIQIAKLNVELDKVMAITLWILVLVGLFDWLVKTLMNYLFNRRYK